MGRKSEDLVEKLNETKPPQIEYCHNALQVRVRPCQAPEMGTFFCMDSSSVTTVSLYVNSVVLYGPLTRPWSCFVFHDLFASFLSLPLTRDISIAMAVSSHVIHQVHRVMGQLCAECCFPLILRPEAGGSLAELKALCLFDPGLLDKSGMS